MVGYAQAKQQMTQGLEAAARAHEAGNLSAIEEGYDDIDALLPRDRGSEFDKLFVALNFWDGWIYSRDHEWRYHKGIKARDWPELARTIVEDLRNDRDITNERVLRHFALSPPGPSLWTQIWNLFGGKPAV